MVGLEPVPWVVCTVKETDSILYYIILIWNTDFYLVCTSVLSCTMITVWFYKLKRKIKNVTTQLKVEGGGIFPAF